MKILECSKTTHLLVSSKEDSSSKLKKAREINCPILLVSEFLSL